LRRLGLRLALAVVGCRQASPIRSAIKNIEVQADARRPVIASSREKRLVILFQELNAFTLGRNSARAMREPMVACSTPKSASRRSGRLFSACCCRSASTPASKIDSLSLIQ